MNSGRGGWKVALVCVVNSETHPTWGSGVVRAWSDLVWFRVGPSSGVNNVNEEAENFLTNSATVISEVTAS
jgi:hypothetical protein